MLPLWASVSSSVKWTDIYSAPAPGILRGLHEPFTGAEHTTDAHRLLALSRTGHKTQTFFSGHWQCLKRKFSKIEVNEGLSAPPTMETAGSFQVSDSVAL